MKKYIVNVELEAEVQESLQHEKVGAVEWIGRLHIAGIADDFHTTGGTPDQVIEAIGIELISVLQARYHGEKQKALKELEDECQKP